MNAGFLARLDHLARCITPAAATLLVLLIGVIPLHVPHYGAVAPLVGLTAIYYWAVQRPDLMPLSLVFIIGVGQDFLIAAPIGVHSFIFVICYWIVFTQRRFLMGKSFFVLWWGLIMTALLAAALEWLCFSIMNTQLMPVEPVLFRALLTAAVFPLIAWLLIKVHRSFLRPI